MAGLNVLPATQRPVRSSPDSVMLHQLMGGIGLFKGISGEYSVLLNLLATGRMDASHGRSLR